MRAFRHVRFLNVMNSHITAGCFSEICMTRDLLPTNSDFPRTTFTLGDVTLRLGKSDGVRLMNHKPQTLYSALSVSQQNLFATAKTQAPFCHFSHSLLLRVSEPPGCVFISFPTRATTRTAHDGNRSIGHVSCFGYFFSFRRRLMLLYRCPQS